MISKFLSIQDQKLIAGVITKSDFCRIVEPSEIVTLWLEDGVVWIRLSSGCIPLCRSWFKAMVKIVKAEQAASAVRKPSVQERLQRSGAYEAAQRVRSGEVKVSPYCGQDARSFNGVQRQLRTEAALAIVR